jgi:hypothetical protein
MMKLPRPPLAVRPQLQDSDRRVESDGAVDESYRLVSIDAVRAPEGCTGADWFSYRITQGMNGITGYRRGNLEQVTAGIEEIVTALNARRGSVRKPESKARAARAAAAAAEKSAE